MAEKVATHWAWEENCMLALGTAGIEGNQSGIPEDGGAQKLGSPENLEHRNLQEGKA